MMSLTAINAALKGDLALNLRPAKQVMNLERLGSMHQSRLSFMRTLIRRIMLERWKISIIQSTLCREGYGIVVYKIVTTIDIFNLVIFSEHLADEERNDRVIADKWDLTMALVSGQVDDIYLSFLSQNVPLQEAGRFDSRVLVLSRANRSARNFNYVVDQLANGLQPDITKIIQVGYLYRTTAVYGSGKFGIADWEKIKKNHPDFARPFAAEMFVCFMIRDFSLLQAEHIAKHKTPLTFTPMESNIKHYFGIGNSTGLGMAPYLINHPLLIDRWIQMRELALALVCTLGELTPKIYNRFIDLLDRVQQHIEQIHTEDINQTKNNLIILHDLGLVKIYVEIHLKNWTTLLAWSEDYCSLETQELIVSILLELYPELVDSLEEHYAIDEEMDLDGIMSLAQFKKIIEEHYSWAININFKEPKSKKIFWYRSEEKMEPRLGEYGLDAGEDKQMLLGIGYEVYKCYQDLLKYIVQYPQHSTARFIVARPHLRGVVKRIQNMAKCIYGDIQANLLDPDILPIHLLRAKLSFFGVSKFDPRSKLWVRNTMYQGAPLLEDIGCTYQDDWFMPLAPAQQKEKI